MYVKIQGKDNKVLESVDRGCQFVTNEVGDSYNDWKPGDRILINANIGTGKTWFVLNRLLCRAILRNEKILYLVKKNIKTAVGKYII